MCIKWNGWEYIGQASFKVSISVTLFDTSIAVIEKDPKHKFLLWLSLYEFFCTCFGLVIHVLISTDAYVSHSAQAGRQVSVGFHVFRSIV